jgi:pantetheine-phosphate adenylyltransferase
MKKGFIGGSFDPITVGHLDMIERASKLCDRLTLAVLYNKDKACMFTPEQRVEMVKAATEHIANVDVVYYDGHMPGYVLDNNYDIVFRGLRNVSDFEYEIGIAQLSAHFFKGRCETLYMMTDPKLSYISSHIVRHNYPLGADVSAWVPKAVLKLMKKYFKVK